MSVEMGPAKLSISLDVEAAKRDLDEVERLRQRAGGPVQARRGGAPAAAGIGRNRGTGAATGLRADGAGRTSAKPAPVSGLKQEIDDATLTRQLERLARKAQGAKAAASTFARGATGGQAAMAMGGMLRGGARAALIATAAVGAAERLFPGAAAFTEGFVGAGGGALGAPSQILNETVRGLADGLRDVRAVISKILSLPGLALEAAAIQEMNAYLGGDVSLDEGVDYVKENALWRELNRRLETQQDAVRAESLWRNLGKQARSAF